MLALQHSEHPTRFASADIRQTLHASGVIAALGFFLEVDSLNFDVLESGIGFEVVEQIDHILIDMH